MPRRTLEERVTKIESDLRTRRHAGPSRHSALHGLDGDDHPGYPKGILDYAQATTAQTGITTETDLTGLSVTVDVPADRTLRVSGLVRIVVGDGVRTICSVFEGATRLGLLGDHTGNGANSREVFFGAVVVTPSAGEHTYNLKLRGISGSAATEADSFGNPEIVVEDLGPA